jgi:hypothetical protein
MVLRYSFVSLRRGAPGVRMAGCPSGQWERTVNPSEYSYAGSNPAPATRGSPSGPGWRRPGRPLTQASTACVAAHVFFELAAGSAMPLASLLGPGPAAVLWGAGTVIGFREAGRRPPSADRRFAVVNGMFLSAVVGHFTAWPWAPNRFHAPWLSRCEGLEGRAMMPYNLILYGSGLSALGALLVENRRGRVAGSVVPVVLVPVVVAAQRWEFRRLVQEAHRRPRWWNRRLQHRSLSELVND